MLDDIEKTFHQLRLNVLIRILDHEHIQVETVTKNCVFGFKFELNVELCDLLVRFLDCTAHLLLPVRKTLSKQINNQYTPEGEQNYCSILSATLH